MDRRKWAANLYHQLSQSEVVCAVANRDYSRLYSDENNDRYGYDEKIAICRQSRAYDTKIPQKISPKRNSFVFDLFINCGCNRCKRTSDLDKFHICVQTNFDVTITSLYIIFEEVDEIDEPGEESTSAAKFRTGEMTPCHQGLEKHHAEYENRKFEIHESVNHRIVNGDGIEIISFEQTMFPPTCTVAASEKTIVRHSNISITFICKIPLEKQFFKFILIVLIGLCIKSIDETESNCHHVVTLPRNWKTRRRK